MLYFCIHANTIGASVTNVVIGSFLYPVLKTSMNADEAWRIVTIIPAVIAFATGVAIYFISDDAPKGNYYEMKQHGVMPEVSALHSFRVGASNLNSWLLFVQYACCFGVELTMNNAATLYFKVRRYHGLWDRAIR